MANHENMVSSIVNNILDNHVSSRMMNNSLSNTTSAPINSPDTSLNRHDNNNNNNNNQIPTLLKNNPELLSSRNKLFHTKVTYPDGSIYEGEFRNDKFNGNGILITKEFRYEGGFLNGKKNGKGKIEYIAEGQVYEKYEGNFINDYKDGYGIEILENGTCYKGNFSKGKKEGQGRMYLENGCEYIGEFNNDLIEGIGFFKWNKNKTYNGEWKNNCINGMGVFIDNDKKYIGYFINDKKNGIGANYFMIGDMYIVSKWKNDKRENGICLLYNKNREEEIAKIEGGSVQKPMSREDIINSKIEETNMYKELKNFYVENIESGKYT